MSNYKWSLVWSVFMLAVAALVLSCSTDQDLQRVPDCLYEKTDSSEDSSIVAIYKFWHGKKKYYYTVAECCDHYNYIYDSRCRQICAPDGGITGMGTGDCPDDLPTDINDYELIWER